MPDMSKIISASAIATFGGTPTHSQLDIDDFRKGLMLFLRALHAQGPSEAMFVGAREWSVEKYGKAIGNNDATGCWQAMLAQLIRDLEGQ